MFSLNYAEARSAVDTLRDRIQASLHASEGGYVHRPTRQTAEIVAHHLYSHRVVLGVELFGSVARDGIGSDLDLILIMDEDTCEDFFTEVNVSIEEFVDGFSHLRRWRNRSSDGTMRCAYHTHHLRMGAAEAVLGRHIYFNEFDLDVFLFPPDWRKRLDELQRELPHSDPGFMWNIARDAIPLIGITRKDMPTAKEHVVAAAAQETALMTAGAGSLSTEPTGRARGPRPGQRIGSTRWLLKHRVRHGVIMKVVAGTEDVDAEAQVPSLEPES